MTPDKRHVRDQTPAGRSVAVVGASDLPGRSSVVLTVDTAVPGTVPKDGDSKTPLGSSTPAVALATARF